MAIRTWQCAGPWVQSCLVRKRPVRISSRHFHPGILYMEASHSRVFSITPGAAPCRRGGGEGRRRPALSLRPPARRSPFSVPRALPPRTRPYHQMAAQRSAEPARLSALTRNSWKRTLHSPPCTDTGGCLRPPPRAALGPSPRTEFQSVTSRAVQAKRQAVCTFHTSWDVCKCQQGSRR